jgi:hypothetical protein
MVEWQMILLSSKRMIISQLLWDPDAATFQYLSITQLIAIQNSQHLPVPPVNLSTHKLSSGSYSYAILNYHSATNLTVLHIL